MPFSLGSLSGSPKKDKVFFWGELWEARKFLFPLGSLFEGAVERSETEGVFAHSSALLPSALRAATSLPEGGKEIAVPRPSLFFGLFRRFGRFADHRSEARDLFVLFAELFALRRLCALIGKRNAGNIVNEVRDDGDAHEH